MPHVTLLGKQMVCDAYGAVRLRPSRTVALVAFLVVHSGSPQTRQRIAAASWPDSTDEQALTNLRRELHHLRGALGDDASLVVTPRDLCWRDTPACRVDVRVFGSERAAALAAAAAGNAETFLAHAAAARDLRRRVPARLLRGLGAGSAFGAGAAVRGPARPDRAGANSDEPPPGPDARPRRLLPARPRRERACPAPGS